MRIVRSYLYPDPLANVFADDAIPNGVFTWPRQERAQRLRYAVISLCAGIHGVIACPMAFSSDPEIEVDIEQTLEQVSDEDIREMVRTSGPADWKRVASAGMDR